MNKLPSLEKKKSSFVIAIALKNTWSLQLCAGAPDKLREQLQLAPPSAFHYLNRCQFHIYRWNYSRIVDHFTKKTGLAFWHSIHNIWLLTSRGCTRYFCSKETDAALPANRKSKAHISQGSLKDPMIDDVKNFQTVDQVISVLSCISEKKDIL